MLGSSSSRGVGQLAVEASSAGAPAVPASFLSAAFISGREYAIAVAGVAALTIACWLLTPLIGYGAISLIFLLGVLLAGMILNRGPVLLVACTERSLLEFPLYSAALHPAYRKV